MFSRSALAQYWADVRPYFGFSIIVYLASLVVGGSSVDSAFLERQMEAMRALVDVVGQTENPQLTLFLLILLNNVFKSIFTMYAGVIACIWPLFMLVANGTFLGYLLANQAAGAGLNPWLLFVVGILPHGIFELTAVFLACGFGMRFGIMLLRGIFGVVAGRPDPWRGFVRTAFGSVPAAILIAVLLFVAAVVESTLTAWLVAQTYGAS
jgi:stage II sporulation protein M